MITKCYTIKKLLCWLDIRMSDCEDRLCLMNNIMADFYDYMYWSPLIKVAEGFVWTWQKVMELAYEPYKIEWFYWYGKWCANNNCFIKVANCIDCMCPELYQIKMENSIHTTDPSQFKVRYEEEDDKWFIDYNIPVWLEQWYVVYTRTHKDLTNNDETICLDPRLLTWLKLMIRKHVAINEKETNMASYYEQELWTWKAKTEKNQSWNLISIITNHVWQLK